MWMPLVGPLPMPQWFGNGWRLGYVLGVRFTGAILGNILMWSGTVLYPIYEEGERYWGISPLADQSTAGAIMMVEGTFVALGRLRLALLPQRPRGGGAPAPARPRRVARHRARRASAPLARSPPATARGSRSA